MRHTPPNRATDRASTRRFRAASSALCALAAASCGSSDSGDASAPPTQPGGGTVLAAATTYGDPLCGAPSRDGSIYVVAEGASLAVLDGVELATGTAANVIARAPTEAAAYALAVAPPHVYLAGGTAGLWRVTIAQGGEIGTVDGAWPDAARIFDAHDAPCLDVEVVADHPAGPLVAAVTSARPGFGVSELHLVDRDPPHALRARVALVPTVPLPGAKAYALASDPTDPATVYVAMGSAGVWRVDTANLAQLVVTRGPDFDRPEEMLGGEPASARDVACARVGARTVVYAAIEAGTLAQIDVTNAATFGPSTPTTRPLVECAAGCGPTGVPYGFRVSALGRADGTAVVALATNSLSAERMENGPFSCLGRWSFDLHLPGAIGPAACGARMFLLDAAAPLDAGAVAPPAVVRGSACRAANARSIDLARQGAGMALFEQRFDGAVGFVLESAPSALALGGADLQPYAGVGLACVDGAASELDAGFLHFGLDGIAAAPLGALRFDAHQGRLDVVEGTNQLCPTSDPHFCNSSEPAIIAPNPWASGLAGGARWIQSSDPGREWFVGGKSRVSRQCPTDPCAWTDDWCSDPWKEEGNVPSDDERPPGWELVRLDTNAAAAGAGAMDVRFWSIASPPDALGRTGRNYLGSAADAAATDDGRLLHLFRGAIREGYLVCSADDVVERALGACGAARGRGQRVEPAWMHVLTTHFELGQDDDPAIALTWRGETFDFVVDGERRSYVAVAAGWIVPVSTAPWSAHANRGQILVYDVTDVDADSPPVLVRMLLGHAGVDGNFVAARVADAGGRTWLFAGDLAGGAHAFEISAATLHDPSIADASDPATALVPAASWYAPPDAYDGARANVTDVEVDAGDPDRVVLVLANARRGLALIDVETTSGGIALAEGDRSPIDTPGIASGIVAFRRHGAGWFAVGDARCGVRVYRRGP